MIHWGNGQHKVVIGMTGTGKTYTTTETVAKLKQGAFFFNTAHVKLPKTFVRASGSASMADLMEIIEDGGKIDFRPSTKLQESTKQLVAIIDSLYSRKWADFLLFVDEAHLYRGEGLQALIRAITTGRNYGVEMVCLTQRLALLDNTIMTQSPYKVVFFLENETQYCLRYGVPYPEIERRVMQKDPGRMVGSKWQPSHAYCTYFMGRIEGAYKYGA